VRLLPDHPGRVRPPPPASILSRYPPGSAGGDQRFGRSSGLGCFCPWQLSAPDRQAWPTQRAAARRMRASPAAPSRQSLRTRRSGSVIGSGRSRIALGERQSAAVMRLGIHTCFQTAMASHREPAMPAQQGREPHALLRAEWASADRVSGAAGRVPPGRARTR
jgi:hypothetical protein